MNGCALQFSQRLALHDAAFCLSDYSGAGSRYNTGLFSYGTDDGDNSQPPPPPVEDSLDDLAKWLKENMPWLVGRFFTRALPRHLRCVSAALMKD